MEKSGTWIFQCNPDRFDIEAYLKQSSGELSWLVTRYKSGIKIGDTVYLWRSEPLRVCRRLFGLSYAAMAG